MEKEDNKLKLIPKIEKYVNKIKNKLNISNIGIMLIILILGVFNFVIGANDKVLRIVPISFLLGLIALYLIVFKIKNKEESIFFKSRIDIFVLIFMFVTTLPLIFGTYASYSDTVKFILKYFFIYSVYILVRNAVKTKKQIEVIITFTLIFSLIPVILQFDYLNQKILKDFMRWLDVVYSKGTAFCGTFGYANAQAIYMAVCIFLAMHKFKVNKNKILKIIDVIYIIFSIYIIFITQSISILLLLGFICFLLFVIKFRKKIIKHKVKILIVISIIGIVLSVFLSIALKIPKSMTKINENLSRPVKYNFKKGEKYEIELDIETKYTGNIESLKENAFIVRIYEIGKYFFDVKLQMEEIGDIKGIYKTEFIPPKDLDEIRIKIVNKYDKGTITLNRCYVNGEEQILYYKYLPYNLGLVLSGHFIDGKSFPQRILMYKDCIKMVGNSPIVGNGGNTWKDLSLSVTEYKGALKESHSYFFELLISYGIVGVIAFYSFIIYFFIKMFKQCKKDKEKRKEKLLLVLGVFILILHSLIDFDMSFMLIQLITFIYIAILLYDEKDNFNNKEEKIKIKNIRNIIDYGMILFLMFLLSIYIRSCVSKYILKDNSLKHIVTPYNNSYYYDKIKEDVKNNKNILEILPEFQDYIKKEPYFTQNENYEMYFNLICKNLDNLSKEELEDNLEFIINKVKNVKEKKPKYFETVIERAQILKDTIDNFENYIKILDNKEQLNEIEIEKEKKEILNNAIIKLKNIIISESERNIEYISEYYRNGYSDSTQENMKEKYKKIIGSINFK